MKALKSVLAILVISLLMVSVSCSKKKSTEPEATTSTTSAMNSTQQQATAPLVASTASTSISQVSSLSTSMMSGSGFKGGKTPPDTAVWHLINTWWCQVYNGTGYSDTIKVRFTPDIWTLYTYPYPSNVLPPQKLEYKYLYSGTGYHYYWDALVQFAGLDTHATTIEGHWNLGYYGSYGNYSYSYVWNTNFDGVSRINHALHCTYSCTYPYSYGASGWINTDITGEYQQDASGYGNLGAGTDGYAGYSATNGTVFIKYYRASSGSPATYYTLLCDSPAWSVKHSWDK